MGRTTATQDAEEMSAEDEISQPEKAPLAQSRSRHYSGQIRYTDAVLSQSKRSKEAYLSSGVHYDALARFLSTESKTTQVYDRLPFAHVVVKTITREGRELTSYDSHSDPAEFCLADAGENETAHLVFIRGFTSPPWLNRICEQTNIRPEYFRRHLSFMDRNEFFDLPTLPSGDRKILRLRITTICSRSVPLSFPEIVKAHEQEEEHITKHRRGLLTSGRAGDSVVRRYAVHNETTFTLGQDITCFVKQQKNGWTGLIWLDVGRDLYEQSPGPWFAKEVHSLSGNHTCLPVIQHRNKVSGPDIPRDLDPRNLARFTSSTGPRFAQSAALLPLQYGGSLDTSTMLSDAIYALSDVIAFAAASEKQFLNMISAQIDKDLRMYLINMEASLVNLSYNKTVLDEHLRASLGTLTTLRTKGGPLWPRVTEDSERMSNTADDTLSGFVDDYEFLVSETKAIIQRCIEGSTLITNRAMLDESRKAAEQNRRIGRLTTLAFFFVPTSFVATFFGMNFKEFGTGSISVWIGILVMAIFILGSAAICFSDQLKVAWKRISGNG